VSHEDTAGILRGISQLFILLDEGRQQVERLNVTNRGLYF
jgi:hypothetical protein